MFYGAGIKIHADFRGKDNVVDKLLEISKSHKKIPSTYPVICKQWLPYHAYDKREYLGRVVGLIPRILAILFGHMVKVLILYSLPR